MAEQTLSNDPIVSDLVREDASFAEIVIQFVDGLSDRVSAMEEAIGASDFESLRVSAHQLKGSGAGYGYPILTEKAALLEDAAKGSNSEACQPLVSEIRSLSSRVVVGP